MKLHIYEKYLTNLIRFWSCQSGQAITKLRRSVSFGFLLNRATWFQVSSLLPPIDISCSRYFKLSINIINYNVLNYPFSQSCPSNIVFSSTGRYNSCSTSLHMCAQSISCAYSFNHFHTFSVRFLLTSGSAFINRSFHPFRLQLHVHVKWLHFNRRIVFNRSHQWNS